MFTILSLVMLNVHAVQPADAPAPVSTEAKSADLIRSYASELEKEDAAVVLDPKGAFLQYTDQLFFVTNEAILTPGQEDTLDVIAASLKRHPHMPVAVVGHADERPITDGTYPNNGVLSLARARAIRGELMKRGVDGIRLHPRGAGDTEPQAANAEISLELNRRVEVRIVPALDLDAVEVTDAEPKKDGVVQAP